MLLHAELRPTRSQGSTGWMLRLQLWLTQSLALSQCRQAWTGWGLMDLAVVLSTGLEHSEAVASFTDDSFPCGTSLCQLSLNRRFWQYGSQYISHM